MKKITRYAILFSTILLILIGVTIWGSSGYAPCSWYQFNMNTTTTRQVMETCLR